MIVDVASIALRALAFAALLLAAGIAIFSMLFREVDSHTLSTLRYLGRQCALVALPLLIAQYLLEAGRMAGDLSGVLDAQLQMVALQSPLSIVLALRLVGLLTIYTSLGRATNTLMSIGVFLTLLSFIFIGHTSTHSLHWLLALLLLVHLQAIAFWFGALPALYLITRREPIAETAAIVGRFSSLALWIVPCIFVAGLLLCIELLPNLAALDSDYGKFLIAKVCGFSLLMGFAAWNKWRLTPALALGRSQAASSLRRSMLAEFLVIVAIIAVTVTMTTLSSPEM